MSGLGAFIEGAMRGYGFAAATQGAKDSRERQKREDKWLDEVRGRQRQEWDRQDKERSVLEAIYNESVASYDDMSEAGPTIDTTAAAGGEAPQVVSTKGSAAAATGFSIIDAMPSQPTSPTENEPPEIAQKFDTAPAQRAPEPPVMAASGTPHVPEEPDAEMALLNDPTVQFMARGQGKSVEDFITEMHPTAKRRHLDRMWKAKSLDKTADDAAYQASLDADLPEQRDLDQRHRETLQRERYGVGSVPERMGSPNRPPEAEAIARSSADTNTPMSAPAALQPPLAERSPSADTTPPAPPLPSSPMPIANASSQDEREMAEVHRVALTQPPDQGGAPSLALAQATAPQEGRGVLGRNDVVKTTEGQRTRAAASFLDHYAQTAVPKLVEYYAQTGQLEKAQAFEQWANARETKSQLESWAKAVHAATIGDDDAFLDHLADTYNSFDDGYEVDRSKSDFVRDEKGNISGGVVTFKNTRTGESFEKTYADQSDIVREAIHVLSPEQVFETLWGEMAQAGEIAAEQRAFERDLLLEQVRSGAKVPRQNEKSVAAAKKALSESYAFNAGPNGKTWSQMTPAEQDQMAMNYVRSNRRAASQLQLPAAPAPYTGG